MITIISHWFNEELVAPLFFRHYSYADRIIILLDRESGDIIRKLCSTQSNVEVREVESDRYDEINITSNKNAAVSEIKEGWVYVVDSDEFIFPENFEDPYVFLGRQKADAVNAMIFHVWKHVDEKDIDYNSDPVPQRVHAWTKRLGGRGFYVKPCVFRAGMGIQTHIGCHSLIDQEKISISSERYIGSHWKHADRSIAIQRRFANRDRMSDRNKKHGYARYENHITEERIDMFLNERNNLPVCEFLVRKT